MKNRFYSTALALVFCGMLIISCKKENVQASKNTSTKNAVKSVAAASPSNDASEGGCHGGSH
jgi:hypothetical protein